MDQGANPINRPLGSRNFRREDGEAGGNDDYAGKYGESQ